MKPFLRRVLWCSLVPLAISIFVAVDELSHRAPTDGPHTILGWVALIIGTIGFALLIGLFLAIWLALSGFKSPEPLAHIGLVWDKLGGLFFVLGGLANLGAACFQLGHQLWMWLATGVRQTVPLQHLFPVVLVLKWDWANTALAWLLATPEWPWVAVIGALLIKMGLAGLRDEDRADNLKPG